MELDIIIRKKVSLPFTIEGDEFGKSYIEFEDGKFYSVNQSYGEKGWIHKDEISRANAIAAITGALDTPNEIRFPKRTIQT